MPHPHEKAQLASTVGMLGRMVSQTAKRADDLKLWREAADLFEIEVSLARIHGRLLELREPKPSDDPLF